MKKELREKVWNKYNCKCAYCGEDLEYKKMQVDHIEPRYLGGENDIKNYNPSCRQCNFYKGTFSLDQFKQQLATITERIKKPFIVRLALKYGIISFKTFGGRFYFEKMNDFKKLNKQNGTHRKTLHSKLGEITEGIVNGRATKTNRRL